MFVLFPYHTVWSPRRQHTKAPTRRQLFTVLALAGCSVPTLKAAAQEPRVDSTPPVQRVDTEASVQEVQGDRRRPFCCGGSPLSACRAFAVTEVVYHLRDDRSQRGLEPYLSWTYGVMVNVADASAVGVALTYSGLSSSPSGLRPTWAIRYRHWTGSPLALDASVGLAGAEMVPST